MQATSLTTADGLRLLARTWESPSPRAAVVLVHGFSASGHHADVCELAGLLHERELDVISYDARGHGGSEGESTLGDLEEHDVAAAVAAARARASRVVLVGASMGAIGVLRYAMGDPSIGGVVSVSCPARWTLPRNARGILSAGLTRTRLGRIVAARFLRVRVARRWTRPAPPIELVPHVKVPVAVVHGSADPFIPIADAHALFAASNEPRRLDLIGGMRHAFDPLANPTIVDAVEWSLVAPKERAVRGRPRRPTASDGGVAQPVG